MRVTAQRDSEAGTTVLFAALRKQHSESTVFADYFEQSKFSMPVIVVFGFVNHTIHMNGRIYDPTLGRMLQADPFIQAPGNTQSYNRYSYVMNNPLGYTDPSGYNWKDWVAPVIAVAAIVACNGYVQCGIEAYMTIGATSGGASAAANGGDFVQGAIVGGISGAAFYGVGTAVGAEHIAVQAFSYGVVGGVFSVATGGRLSHGFISAGAGALIPGGLGGNSYEMMALRTIGRAIIGGTVSELTGGKFANGAATAAFASVVAEGVAAANDPDYADEWYSEYELPDDYYSGEEKLAAMQSGPPRLDGQVVQGASGGGGSMAGGGLAGRGVRPALGTRVRPDGVPENWRIRPTYSKGGTEYYNPRNPDESVRVMQGNPRSPYPNSQKPYVRQTDSSGKFLNASGNRGIKNSADTHIPLDQYKYMD